jgi:hypothetical protein
VSYTTNIRWVFEADAAGIFSVTITARGTNAGSSTTRTVIAEGAIQISPSGADFDVSLAALPATVGIDELITVVMTVSNIGQQDANLVIPANSLSSPNAVTPTVSGTGSAFVVDGPVPLSAVAVAQGQTVSFTWTYSAVAGGDVVFNGGIIWQYDDPLVLSVTKTAQVSSNTVSIQYGVTYPGAGDSTALSVNQFNPAAGERVDVIFSVTAGADSASLLVFNVAGQRVRTITSSQAVVPGIVYTQLLYWDGRADDGMLVTSGIYYIKLKAGAYEAVKMVAVIKQ